MSEEYHNSPSDEVEDRWADFMAGQGLDLEDEIQKTLEDNISKLDMIDGTHGQWQDDALGVLIVFDGAEVEKIVDSWALAMDGNLMAMSHIMNWMEGFQYFLEDCLNKRDNQ